MYGNEYGSGKRRLVLKKGAERYVFRYNYGEEDALLDAIMDAATNKGNNFDWFDAAVLSFKVVNSLIGQADELLKQDPLKKNTLKDGCDLEHSL